MYVITHAHIETYTQTHNTKHKTLDSILLSKSNVYYYTRAYRDTKIHTHITEHKNIIFNSPI